MRDNIEIRPGRILWVAAMILALMAVTVVAQEQCLVFETDPAPATVSLRYSIGVAAPSPATFCTLVPGQQYFLIISRPGYEARGIKMKLDAIGEPPKFKGFRLRMVSRSMILPGWGQRTMRVNGRILESIAFLSVAGFRTYQGYLDYRDVKDRYDVYEGLAKVTQDQEKIKEFVAPMQKAAMDSNALREYTLLTGATAVWLYTENLVESFLLAQPPKMSQTTDFGYMAKIPRQSRTRAALRSMFFPGLGQKYYGKTWKGVLFKSGFYTLVWFTLDRKRMYDQARINYELSVGRLQDATSGEDRNRILFESAVLYDGMKTKEDMMYYWAIGTGAVWLINVLDAAISGASSENESRVRFSSGFGREQSRIGLSVSF
jgi:hypothetical protein